MWLYYTQQKRVNRTIWQQERKTRFWEMDVSELNDIQFKENFRLTRQTFAKLLEKVRCLEEQDTNMRRCIPLDKRVAIALYALGSSAEYRTISNLFGVGRTTVTEIVLGFCEAVNTCMEKDYICGFPSRDDLLREVAAGFDHMGFPQCYGAIDGTHIEIQPPSEDAVDYHNYKGWNSIILLAVADYKYQFTYINIGAPGRSNDSFVFENLLLKTHIEEHPLFKNTVRPLGTVDVPVLLIGDSAFRRSTSVMKPYPYQNEQPHREQVFNYHLSKCRRVIENAFGHLKGRWRRVGRGLENNLENVPALIKTCCILHNVCTAEGDPIPQTWMTELCHWRLNPQPHAVTVVGNNLVPASRMRDVIATYLMEG